MQKSQIINLSWSSRVRGNDNEEDAWPELGRKNQMKFLARKSNSCTEDTINVQGANIELSLDNYEYPELGERINRNRSIISSEKFCQWSHRSTIPASPGMSQELKRSHNGSRHKRTAKIYINLQEALQNTKYIKKTRGKVITKLKLNICKSHPSLSVSTVTDKGNNSEIQKIKMCISKGKKPTKLKKIILLDRDIKAQINIRKRAAFEYEKTEAICKDVNAINFNALKITADPELDVDYVKSMSTLSFYDKSYRNKTEENILENTVDYRPDITDSLYNLYIRGKAAQNYLVKYGNTSMVKNCENIDESDLLRRTLALEINEDDKEEIQNSTLSDSKISVKHSRNFREYCTNTLTPELNKSLESLLCEITRLQRKYYEKDRNRAKYKRRYYSGLKEVRKHVELKKVKFVIVAPDVEKVVLQGGLDDEVYNLLEMCKKHNVVFCFGLRRRKLGYYGHGKGLVGCIGIANYNGTEEILKNVLLELVRARNAFNELKGETDAIIDTSNLMLDDYLPAERVNVLMKLLAPLDT